MTQDRRSYDMSVAGLDVTSVESYHGAVD
jgi:hypothetical protein